MRRPSCRKITTISSHSPVAAIHRANKPDSKRAFANWAKQTTLPKLASFDPNKLDSQHFWDQIEYCYR